MARLSPSILSLLLSGGLLSGCALQEPPLVAYPGQNKTAEALRADDAACRQQAAAPVPAEPATTPATAAQPATAPAPVPAETLYLQCMASRGNVVGAAPVVRYAPPPSPYYYDAWWSDPFWPGYYGSPFFAWRSGWGGYYSGFGGYWGGYRGVGWRGGYGRWGGHPWGGRSWGGPRFGGWGHRGRR